MMSISEWVIFWGQILLGHRFVIFCIFTFLVTGELKSFIFQSHAKIIFVFCSVCMQPYI